MLIDNTNLIAMCNNCGAVGFLPAATYAYDATLAQVVVTDATVLPAGDTLARIKVSVHDFFGKEVRDTIGALLGNTGVIDVSTLDRSKPLAISYEVHTAGHLAADGGVYGLVAAGDVGHWDVQNNA